MEEDDERCEHQMHPSHPATEDEEARMVSMGEFGSSARTLLPPHPHVPCALGSAAAWYRSDFALPPSSLSQPC